MKHEMQQMGNSWQKSRSSLEFSQANLLMKSEILQMARILNKLPVVLQKTEEENSAIRLIQNIILIIAMSRSSHFIETRERAELINEWIQDTAEGNEMPSELEYTSLFKERLFVHNRPNDSYIIWSPAYKIDHH